MPEGHELEARTFDAIEQGKSAHPVDRNLYDGRGSGLGVRWRGRTRAERKEDKQGSSRHDESGKEVPTMAMTARRANHEVANDGCAG